MARNRPCAVCGIWFRPNPRLGNRQQTCGLPACKQEWHRRLCARWRKRNPDYDQETRLVDRLVKDPPTPRGREPDPLRRIDWNSARAVVGLPVSILVQETAKVLVQRPRESIPR